MRLLFLASLFIAGFGLFFVGLRLMTRTFHEWAGPRVEILLARYTSRPVVAMASGLIVAVLLQSSSATNVIVVGLVGAGLVDLRGAFAVILGSNVGTTATAHLVTLPLKDVAPHLIVLGAALGWLNPRRFPFVFPMRIVAALGAIFYGLGMVSLAFYPLLDHVAVRHGLEHLAGSSATAVAVGALLTAIVQSSSMVTTVAVAMASDGILTTAGAIAIALGSNVGTVTTTLLASVWGNANARRAALADLFFNVLGVLLVLPFLTLFVHIISLTASVPGRQVANAHTLFNIVTALAAFPFITPICHWIERITQSSSR